MSASPAAPVFPVAPSSGFARGWGWGLYLVLAACLIPVLKPEGPNQFIIADALNIIGLLVFGCAFLARRQKLELPLIIPVMIVLVGSLYATANAESFGRSAVALLQDAYVYIWFIFLVNILRERGDQRELRIGWMWAANATAVLSLALLLGQHQTTFVRLFGPKGMRAVGLFDGPNSLADYLMMSLFVVLSLSGQISGFLVWGSTAVVMLGLIATKSNGAMSGWLLGMVAWAIVRALTKTKSLLVVASVGMVMACVALLGWWATKEWNLGAQSLESFRQQSFMARLDRSTESREQIWGRLVQRYMHSPLGIGPGNSAGQHVSLGHRERRMSYRSKEAHNDYIGYLVERGPLGLLGLVVLVVQPFVAIWLVLKNCADEHWKTGAGGAIAAALVGGLVATTVHSFVIEKLHFRHFWMFLAIVFAFRAVSPPRLALATVRTPNEDHDRRGPRKSIAPPRSWHEVQQSNGVHPESI